MQLTFGIKLNPEDQMVGMDMAGHGESWHGPAIDPLHSATKMSNKGVAPNILPATIEDANVASHASASTESRKRSTITDSLHDAFV
jgi:hypothetical protein